MNHESISWFHEPKICKTSIFQEYFFWKTIILKSSLTCLSIFLQPNEWDWTMKEKRFVECFGFFQIRPLCNNMKYYKNIACIYFVNVNIALNSYAYEENQSFMLEFIQKVYFSLLFVSWNPRHLFMIRSQSYSHISYNIIILIFHETIFF